MSCKQYRDAVLPAKAEEGKEAVRLGSVTYSKGDMQMPLPVGYTYIQVPISKTEKAEYDAIRKDRLLASAPVHAGSLIRKFIESTKGAENAGKQ